MTSIAPGNQTVDPPRRSRALGVPRWLPHPTLIILRLLPLIPVLLLTVLGTEVGERPVGAVTWGREAAVINLLYGYLLERGLIQRRPFRLTGRGVAGTRWVVGCGGMSRCGI